MRCALDVLACMTHSKAPPPRCGSPGNSLVANGTATVVWFRNSSIEIPMTR